jgi:uncharacterized protein with FMN-binding domain
VHRVTLWLATTAVLVMLLFSYHTSTGGTGTPAAALAPAKPGGPATPGSAATPGSSGSSTAAPSGPATSGPATSPATSPAASTSGTFTGGSVDTRWGPVQVQITVQDGKVTDVQAVVYPQGNPRDIEINDYALPLLHDEVITAQSAQIDAVSGATVTSEGYIGSLQSALDAAHLGG